MWLKNHFHCRFLPLLARTSLEDAMKEMGINKITRVQSVQKELNIMGNYILDFLFIETKYKESKTLQ